MAFYYGKDDVLKIKKVEDKPLVIHATKDGVKESRKALEGVMFQKK